MENNPLNPKEALKTLRILHFALLAGMIFFSLVALFLFYNGLEPIDVELSRAFTYIIPIFVVSGYATSHLLFRNRMGVARAAKDLTEKLTHYRAALIVRLALLEGPAFFAIVAYMLTSELIFLGWAAIIIVYFITLWPTPAKIVADLALNYNEQHELEGN